MDNRQRSRRASYTREDPEKLDFSSSDVEMFWSKVAENDYEQANENLHNTHVQRFEISVPLLSLPVYGNLLNLWCRQGEAIPYIRRCHPKIKLINAEISNIMLQQAQKKFPSEYYIRTDLISIDLPDNSIDAILSLEMLEHSPSPINILREFHRVLKPGAQLVLTCPSYISEFHLWVADKFLNNHGEGPHRFPSVPEVKRMLAKSGFLLHKHKSTLFIPEELGAIAKLNNFMENYCQWYPASEFGLRQLYIANSI